MCLLKQPYVRAVRELEQIISVIAKIFGECSQFFKWKNILLTLKYISIFLGLQAYCSHHLFGI